MNTASDLSVILLTQDEEANIQPCLESLAGLARDIYVVDSGSTDQTLELAGQFTDLIFHHPFENYSLQRNWAQDNLPLKTGWVFHIDADERVSAGLKSALLEFFSDQARMNRYAGLMVRRRIEFLGRHIKHGGLYPTYHTRIFQVDKGRCEDRDYDQHFLVEGELAKIPRDLVEITATSLLEWTARHNRWAQLEAGYLLDQNMEENTGRLKPDVFGTPIERRRWLREEVLEKTPLFWKAGLYFLYRYLLRGGFLDGREGLIYHVLHGFWFRFYVDACVYERKLNASGGYQAGSGGRGAG